MQMKISATINRLVDKPDSNIKAFASVSFDGFYAVHGIKVCEGEKGRFVSMPSTEYTDRDGNKQVQQTEIEVENSPDEEMSGELSDEPEPEISM